MARRWWCSAGAVLLLLGGCSLTPEHTLGPSPVAANWPEELLQGPAAPDIADGGAFAALQPGVNKRPILPPLTEQSWRDFFTDPGLQAAIAAALDNNRNLAASLARVSEARAEARLANAELWPAIDLQAQRGVQHTPETVREGKSTALVSGTTNQRYDVNLRTSYELDFWGRASSQDEAARARFLASEFAHRAFRIQVIADTAGAWYTLESWQQREHLLKLAEAARKTYLELTLQRRDVGLVSDLDVAAARVSYHATRTDRFNASRQRVFAENALRLFVGSDIDPVWRAPLVLDARMPPLPIFPQPVIGLPSEVILHRPDIQAAEERLRAARADIGAARAAFLPSLTLTAAAGTASNALSDLFSSGSGAWLFTPVLHLPLFDGGRREADFDIAKAREVAAVADYERAVQQAFREVADALAVRPYGWVVVTEMVNTAEAQLDRLRLVEARHEAGVANYLELLDARRDALAGQDNQLVARHGVQMAAVAIFKAVGGF